MSESDDQIAEGREAWGRLRERDRATWSDWLAVGEALILGRTSAMQTAKTNKPLGSKYNRLVGAWLRANGFDGITNQERYRAILCAEHKTEIEAWRATLDEAKRRKLSHPGAVWSHWRHNQPGGERPQRPQRLYVAAVHGRPQKGRPIFWPGETIRRAAAALRESSSRDLFILAHVALQAAIRSEDDIVELINVPACAPAKPSLVENAIA
jgi:hypothetical protein